MQISDFLHEKCWKIRQKIKNPQKFQSNHLPASSCLSWQELLSFLLFVFLRNPDMLPPDRIFTSDGVVLFWGWLVHRIMERLLAWLHWNLMEESSQRRAMANWILKSNQITDRCTVETNFHSHYHYTTGDSQKTVKRSKNTACLTDTDWPIIEILQLNIAIAIHECQVIGSLGLHPLPSPHKYKISCKWCWLHWKLCKHTVWWYVPVM